MSSLFHSPHSRRKVREVCIGRERHFRLYVILFSFLVWDVVGAVSYRFHACVNWHFLQHRAEIDFQNSQFFASNYSACNAMSDDWQPHVDMIVANSQHDFTINTPMWFQQQTLEDMGVFLEQEHVVSTNLPVGSNIVINDAGLKQGGLSPCRLDDLSVENLHFFRRDGFIGFRGVRLGQVCGPKNWSTVPSTNFLIRWGLVVRPLNPSLGQVCGPKNWSTVPSTNFLICWGLVVRPLNPSLGQVCGPKNWSTVPSTNFLIRWGLVVRLLSPFCFGLDCWQRPQWNLIGGFRGAGRGVLEYNPFLAWIQKMKNICGHVCASSSCRCCHSCSESFVVIKQREYREDHFSKNISYHRKGPDFIIEPNWLFCSTYRIGEAKNPGPFHQSSLKIFHCNPTQLWGKVDEILNFGCGATFLSETSATAHAQSVMTKQLCKQFAGVQWSKPVSVYPQSTSNLRGLAGGTAIISGLPITPVLEPLPDDLANSDRIAEGVIQYAPGCYMYGAALYGPTMSNRYHDPLEILNRHANVAGQRAIRFEGPAIISGDLNVPLDHLQIWPTLQRAGWKDAHVLSQQLNGHEEEMTCSEATRHSFILINPPLVACLKECRTTKHFIFSQHPVLFADFAIENLQANSWVWKLPKSFDRFFNDEQIAQEVAEENIKRCKAQCDKYLAEGDTTSLAKQWAKCAEETLAAAAVDVEGNLIKVRKGHFGRDKGCPFAKRLPSTPVIKPPRKDHHCVQITQGTIEIRRYLKQLHRIQTLHAVAKTISRAGDRQQRKLFQAQHLWSLVRTAKGFTGGFDSWLFEKIGPSIPVDIPDMDFLDDLLKVYFEWFHKIETSLKLHKANCKKIDIIADIHHGGALAFREVREDKPNPMMAIHFSNNVNIRRTRWPKQGRDCLIVAEPHDLNPTKEVVFQGQSRHIKYLGKDHIILDEPVKLRSNDMVLRQQDVTASPSSMHCKLKEAWTPYFQRDSFKEEEQNWDDTIPFINTLQSCSTMDLQPLTPEILQAAMNKTKIASARGCDAFSTKDYRKMPIPLWRLLCDLLRCIEQGAEWPKTWVVAKTLCLPKGNDPRSPMDVRPVTILAKAYRVWAKVRGKQIALHLASLVPPTVGGPCKGISSEIIAMLTSDIIEEHTNKSENLAGLVLDVVKCYNGIPRQPLNKAMERLGVHPQLIQAFHSMMNQMERHFEIAHTVGPAFQTSTGIVEGCGVAVAGMLVVAMLCESAVRQTSPNIYTVMFADNWSFMDKSPENIKEALSRVVALLDSFKMQISPHKSWSWALSTSQRKALATLEVKGNPIPVVLHATDLGVDQNYSRKCIHKTKNSKWDKTKGRLGLIKKPRFPRVLRKD